MNLVCLIPARSGSERVKDKNIRSLNGSPLIHHTIKPAIKSGVFKDVFVATDSSKYAMISEEAGAKCPFLRPKEISGSTSPDIEWVKFFIEELLNKGYRYDAFSILRPTSPFRTVHTLKRAFDQFKTLPKNCSSLRAVEICKQHPGKMWVQNGKFITPLLPFKNNEVPWHSSQTKSLETFYVQNASLEISYISNVIESNSISGEIVSPFFTKDYEGFDINTESDFALAEKIAPII